MTGDGLAVLKLLFVDIWRLFTSWCIPGTRITPAAWAFFSLAVVAALKLLRDYFLGGDSDV